MKKSFFLILALSVAMLSYGQTKLRFGSVIPADSPWEDGLNGYIKAVNTKANGEIKFKKYLGGQLGGEVEMIKSIALGTLDGGAFSTAAIAEALNIPQLETLELPFLFNSDGEADYVMDKLFSVISKYFEDKGVVLVMWGTNGWRSFGTKNSPVKSPNDLKGLKMRSQESDVYINFYKTMGATPVPMATPDVLMSLKTGMVDGYDQTPVFSLSTGWINTVKYFTLTKHIYQPGAIILSKKFYDKLTSNQQDALMVEDQRATLQKKSRRLIRQEDADILSTFPSLGITVTKLTKTERDAFKKACDPVYTKLEKKVGKHILKLVRGKIQEYRSGKR